jgi:hypothetical protein
MASSICVLDSQPLVYHPNLKDRFAQNSTYAKRFVIMRRSVSLFQVLLSLKMLSLHHNVSCVKNVSMALFISVAGLFPHNITKTGRIQSLQNRFMILLMMEMADF